MKVLRVGKVHVLKSQSALEKEIWRAVPGLIGEGRKCQPIFN